VGGVRGLSWRVRFRGLRVEDTPQPFRGRVKVGVTLNPVRVRVGP